MGKSTGKAAAMFPEGNEANLLDTFACHSKYPANLNKKESKKHYGSITHQSPSDSINILICAY